MAVFEVSRDVLPLLDQVVFVNGVQNDEVWCSGITRGSSIGGTSAEFTLPQHLYDTDREALRDALVSVWVKSSDGTIPDVPDFVGYLTSDAATCSGSDDSVKMSAVTISKFLSRVWIGQETATASKTPLRRYLLVDPYTGVSTSWTPGAVLAHIVSELPSYYAARLALGVATPLQRAAGTQSEVAFNNAKYDSAITEILALLGDVGMRERHDASNITYLDFYRISDPSAPSAVVRVANWADPVTSEANVAAISRNVTSDECVTRVIGYGGPRRHVVSVYTTDAVVARRLVRDWSASLEAAVLADPEAVKADSPGYVAGSYRVFRRYRLPAVFNSVRLRKDLPLVRTNGQAYNCQAWLWKNTLTWDTDHWDATPDAAPTLIRNAHFELDKGYVDLQEPALKVTSVTQDPTNSQPVYTYAEAVVGVTICYEGPGYLHYDTGADAGSDLQLDFKSDGLTEQVCREDIGYSQLTNTGFPLNGQTFGCVYFSEENEAYTSPGSVVLENGYDRLAQLCRDILREKNMRRRSYDITIPYFTRAYDLGTNVAPEGEADYVPGTYMVTAVKHDLDANQTTITLDNVKPPHRVDAKSSRRPMMYTPQPDEEDIPTWAPQDDTSEVSGQDDYSEEGAY